MIGAPVALALALVGLVVAAAAILDGRTRRRLCARLDPRDRPGVGARASADASPLDALGWVDRSLGAVGGTARRVLGRPRSPEADRRVGGVLVGVGLTIWVHPMLSLALGAALVARRWFQARAATRRAARAVVDELPDLVDVVALAVQGGASIHQAVASAAAAGSGRCASGLVDALQRTEHGGARLADALDDLPDHLGDAARPFVRALVASERYGVSAGPALDLVGRDLRDQRRRRAEEDIRRVPVRLVFPLVCCILPAFVVLTVVPLLLASLGQLPR